MLTGHRNEVLTSFCQRSIILSCFAHSSCGRLSYVWNLWSRVKFPALKRLKESRDILEYWSRQWRQHSISLLVFLCYILKHKKDLKLWYFRNYCTSVKQFQSAQKFLASPCSCVLSLRIRIRSSPCKKYEQITPSYLLSANEWKSHFSSHLRDYSLVGKVENNNRSFLESFVSKWKIYFVHAGERKLQEVF